MNQTLNGVCRSCSELSSAGFNMYQKGDLKIWNDREFDYLSDARGKKGKQPEGTVYLPHSCQEWVIGGVEQVKQMIEDLQEILMEIEKP